MFFLVGVFLVGVFFNSCDFKKNKRIIEIKKECLSNEEKEEVVLGILSSKNVKQYLHFNQNEKRPIEILKNKYLNDSLDVYFNNNKVRFIDSLSNQNRAIKISFYKIKCNEFIEFSFYYKFEGAHIEGILKKKDNSWKLDKITLDGEE